MKYAQYSVQCQVLEDVLLPSYKGSMLRGAFGNALKKAVCTVSFSECHACLLYKKCLFATFFEPQLAQITDSEQKPVPILPHPYIIEPPLDEKIQYTKGDVLEFNLILFGNANEYLAFFIYAFEIMGKQGLGKKGETGARVSFNLLKVMSKGVSIYDAQNQQVKDIPDPQDIYYTPFPLNSLNSEQTLELKLLTPLRYKADNHLSNKIDFLQVYKLMSRRIQSLFSAYDTEEIEINNKELFPLAQSIKTISDKTYWHDNTRFSQKQQSKLYMGGLMGSVLYQGDLFPFIPLLDMTKLFHLGKQTSFGLGKIEYTLKG